MSIGRLVQDMSNISNRYPERIAENEKQFKEIDFSNARLFNSGLLKDLIDSFYQMMGGYGNQEKASEHANEATAVLLKSVHANPEFKKEIAEYLYKRMEEVGLSKSAEYLVLKMLGDTSCLLDNKVLQCILNQ